jgi:hypothetical protein
MRGWASLFRRRGEPAPELYAPLAETTQPPPTPELQTLESEPTSELPTLEPEPTSLPPEEGARELVFAIMRAAPDPRYRAARALGLLEGQDSRGGPDFERRLLERARDRRQLAALEEALRG